MGPALLMFAMLAMGGVVAVNVTLFSRLSELRSRLALLERERERDRELLEAVLLEDPAKLRRLMGTRE